MGRWMRSGDSRPLNASNPPIRVPPPRLHCSVSLKHGACEKSHHFTSSGLGAGTISRDAPFSVSAGSLERGLLMLVRTGVFDNGEVLYVLENYTVTLSHGSRS